MASDHDQHRGVGDVNCCARVSKRRQIVRRHHRQSDRQEVRGVVDHVNQRLTGHVDAEVRPSHPRNRRRSPSIATGNAWNSPAGAPSATTPRDRPRRLNRGPIRPTMRMAIPVARCSIEMSSSPPPTARRSTPSPASARRDRSRRVPPQPPSRPRSHSTTPAHHRRPGAIRADSTTGHDDCAAHPCQTDRWSPPQPSHPLGSDRPPSAAPATPHRPWMPPSPRDARIGTRSCSARRARRQLLGV